MEVSGWSGKDGKGHRWQVVGGGGSEGGECRKSTGEEVMLCQGS